MTAPENVTTIETLESLVSRDARGSLAIRKVPNWVAVPVQSRSHLKADLIKKLTEIWTLGGSTRLAAVLLEPLLGVEKITFLSPNQSDLVRFDHDYAHFNVALYSDRPGSAVICTTDDFLVVAGPEGFVSSVTGPVSEAYARFVTFLNGDGFDERARSFFMSVLGCLRDTYPKLEVGESAVFLEMPGPDRVEVPRVE